jgi:hypothetical protein
MWPRQLEALNRKRVQQRKRTIDESTRMAGQNFVSGHMDPKIQRTIEDMAPMLHKPEAQARDPTDIESYLEECRQQLVINTISEAQEYARDYSDDAFESAMQRDWQIAQRRLLEDLSGDANPFMSGEALGAAGAGVPFSGEATATSEVEIRKVHGYVGAVAGITGRADTNLREKVADLADACVDEGTGRNQVRAAPVLAGRLMRVSIVSSLVLRSRSSACTPTYGSA